MGLCLLMDKQVLIDVKVGCGKTFTMMGDPADVYLPCMLGSSQRNHTKIFQSYSEHN